LLVNSASDLTESETRAAGDAAQKLGLKLNVLNATNESEIDAAFANVDRQRPLVISTDSFFTNRPGQLVALAVRHGVPVMYAYRDFVAAGGPLSYGTIVAASHRQAGVYAGRILKGEKPADLPVQQVTRVELAINMKTAKALGLTVPLPLLGRAD